MMVFDLPWVITVSDGAIIRTIHPPTLTEDQRRAVEAVLLATVVRDPPPVPPAPIPAHPVEDTLTQHEIARSKGFTGNNCGKCGSFNMVRSGTCETCRDCGEASGGCA